MLEWGDPLASRVRLDGRASAGEEMWQAQLYLDARRRWHPLWRALVSGNVQYRDDRSFGSALRDFKTSARVGVERSNEDLSTTLRGQYLFDLSEGKNADGSDYFPDYVSHRAALVYDRFSWSGLEWGAGLIAGYRSFPDTTQRSHWTYTAETRLRTGGGASALEGLAIAERRVARDASATGDRFWRGDLDLRGRLGTGGAWSAEGRFAWSGTRYDEPTATFIDHQVWQGELGMRFEEVPGRLVRPRLTAEFLRVPGGGGLPPSTSPSEVRSAEAEEFDEWAGRVDLDLLGGAAWLNLYGGFGRRQYVLEADDEANLLSRSSFWQVDFGGFSELALARAVRLRLSGDLHHELHDVTSDDLTSLFVSTQLLYRF